MLCLHQVLELFCQLAEPEKIVGDLWKELHVASGVTGEAGNHLEKAVPSWEKSPFRARAYTVFISRKKYSPLHTVRVFRWFSAHFRVKALFFKHSHGQQSIHMGGERLWRVEKASRHTWNSWKSGKKSLCVKEWMLFSGNKIRIEKKIEKTITWQPFTLQTSESYAIIKEWRPPWKNT